MRARPEDRSLRGGPQGDLTAFEEMHGLLEAGEHAPLPVERQARGGELPVDPGAVLALLLENLQRAKEVYVARAALADVVLARDVEAAHASPPVGGVDLPPRAI